jgi:hypothetical protein
MISVICIVNGRSIHSPCEYASSVFAGELPSASA